MQTLWKQREELHPSFSPINNSLTEDWFLLEHEIRLQRGHASALEAAGVLSEPERAALIAALDAVEQEFLGGPVPESNAEDLHTWMEIQLVDRAGPGGRKIHTARSRNDQVATLLVQYVRGAGARLDDAVHELVRMLCGRALDWADLAFPLQTHSQFAAPGSVGAWAVRHAVAFDRLRRHLSFLRGEWGRSCPLGSGAVAGSSIPIDRSRQARALGFLGASPSAIHSTSARDECLDLLDWCSRCSLQLQSLAADVLVFSQTPFGWTSYPAGFGTGSSMMPNKTNPDAMELLRGRANTSIAAQHEAVLLMKGLPSGYHRDLQCIKPLVHKAAVETTDLVQLTSCFFEALEFDADRLSASLAQGKIDATLEMESLVSQGVPLRDAHRRIAASIQSTNGSRGPSDSRTETESRVTGESASMRRYRTLGSASPQDTKLAALRLLESW